MNIHSEARLSDTEQYSSRYITAITIVATLGGFLMGYDTAVVAGAIGSLKVYFQLSNWETGFAAGCALIGCMAGAMIAGYLSFRIGRKYSLLVAASLFAVSAIGTAIPETFVVFIIYRILGGIGVGIVSMVSPMYIAEIAPVHMRGRLVSYNQMAVVLGIFVVYFVNYFIDRIGDDEWDVQLGWRYMLASETLPSIFFLGLVLLIPESPRWLMLKYKDEKAAKILARMAGALDAVAIQKEIRRSMEEEKKMTSSVLSPLMLKVVLVGVGLSVFQQVTGINAFLYYAPVIFKGLGSSGDTSMLQTVLVGTVNMVFTLVAIFTVDKLGRKPLMIIGAAGMGICLVTIGYGAYTENLGTWLVWFVLGYIAFFALSLGPVVWVLLAEMFPNRARSAGMSIAVAAQWISNFAVTSVFPVLIVYLNGALAFWIFGLMCVATIIFVLWLVPETKGKTLEQMERTWESKFPAS